MSVDFFKSEDAEYLVCQVEINDHCITVYGRVRDDNKRWAAEMQNLIRAVDPELTCHSDEDRALFHPKGSPRKVGYKYIHHVHSPVGLSETISRIRRWLPPDLEQKLSERL